MTKVSETEVVLIERAADATERLQQALENLADCYPTDEDIEQLTRAADTAQSLKHLLQMICDEGLIPGDKDIEQITKAAEAADGLVSSLKLAEELQEDLSKGGER